MTLEYKVILAIPGNEEIGFIQIPTFCQHDYNYLRQRVATSFPILNNHDFNLYWIDEDGDKVRINSYDDLVALRNRPAFPSIRKLCVTLKGAQDNITNDANSRSTVDEVMSILNDTKPIHIGIHCDVCRQTPLRGYRYKCLVCPDYDLCINCETSGNVHSHHPMARLPMSFTGGTILGK